MKTTQNTITATGVGSGVTHTLDLSGPDSEALVAVGGTFTGCTFTITGKPIGGTLSVPLSILNRKTLVRSNGAESASDSTATAWQVDVRGMQSITVYESAGGTPTSVTVEIVSGRSQDFGDGTPLVQVVNSSASAFGAGISFTAATGSNTITITDNLADALSIKEGSNYYITVVTTDSGEVINLRQDVAIIGGKDLTFTGTTGQSQINVTDNLADALSIKIAGGNDFIVLKSTDSAEATILGTSGQFFYQRTAVPTVSGLVNKATITTAGSGTYTAANIIGGLVLRDPNGSSRTDTTHTAAQLVAALPGVAVDDVFDIMIVNTADAAETITLQGGSNVTLVPSTITIAQNEIFIGKVRFTNVTGSSEAVTIYGGNVAG